MKLNKEYIPPKISLTDVVQEYEITFTNEDLQVLNNLHDILVSGVKSASLKYNCTTGKIDVISDFKSINCSNVIVKKISNIGNICRNISDTKLHIQCSQWLFPCPDYKYNTIKKNLEKAIESILNIRHVEVESFITGIVEYD